MRHDDFYLMRAAIGETIFRARVKRGFTQQALTAKMGSPRTYISKIENGHAMPMLNMLQVIARALDTTAWNLVRNAEMRVAEGIAARNTATPEAEHAA